MTLTTRLTVIALAALAVVLAGFSTALYLVAADHLSRRADERLTAAVNVLVAAAEVKPDGVEWEPAERRLGLGPGDGLVWLVTTPDGKAVDRAAPADAADFLADAATHLQETQRPAKKVRWQEGRWLVRQERIEAATPDLPFAPATGPEQKFPALVVTTGVSLEPVRATRGNWRRCSSGCRWPCGCSQPPWAGPSAGGRCGPSPGWRTRPAT